MMKTSESCGRAADFVPGRRGAQLTGEEDRSSEATPGRWRRPMPAKLNVDFLRPRLETIDKPWFGA
jgi:hypothetical protein